MQRRPRRGRYSIFSRAGSDIAPQPGQAGIKQRSGKITLNGADFTPVWENSDGPGMIRAIEFSAPRAEAIALSRARLRIVWDGRKRAFRRCATGAFLRSRDTVQPR